MASIICDIDGTLLEGGRKPIQRTISWVNSQHGKYKVILITARSEARRSETVAELRQNGVKYDKLLMNSVGPSHQDGLESKRINGKSVSRVVLAIDNDADARAVYERLGYKTISPGRLSATTLDKSFWSGII